MLAYNADLVRQAGLNPDAPPEDWAGVRDWAIKLTKRDASGKLIQAGINLYLGSQNPHWFSWYLAPWIGGAGAKLWKSPTETGLADEGFVAAIQFAQDLVNKDKVTDRSITATEFVTGKAAISTFGNWDYDALGKSGSQMDVRYIAVPPRIKAGQPATMNGGWNIVVSSLSKNPHLAWDYIRFTLRKDCRLEWAKLTQTPPLYKDIAGGPVLLQHAVLQAAKPRVHSPGRWQRRDLRLL